jgi:hypothetical protein
MRPIFLFTLCSALATTASATTHVYVKPCYYADSCETYEYAQGVLWEIGQCSNFPRGMASFSVYDVPSYCRFYSGSNCEGSAWTVNIDNTWFNSNIGWIWSFKCT